jgi:hypothetical protein
MDTGTGTRSTHDPPQYAVLPVHASRDTDDPVDASNDSVDTAVDAAVATADGSPARPVHPAASRKLLQLAAAGDDQDAECAASFRRSTSGAARGWSAPPLTAAVSG